VVAIGRLRSDREARVRALESYEHAADLPLLILALGIVPLLVLPLAFDLPPAMDNSFYALDWMIWAAFAFDLTVRTYLTQSRSRYLVSHWYDVGIVVLSGPFLFSQLRPLRILRSARVLRLLRLARAAVFSVRFFATVRTLARRNGLAYVLGGALVLIIIAASLVFAFERTEGGPIDDFGTAMWWAVVTVTTVGYGDTFPVTPEGRGVAVFLMILGISLFGFLTANIAAFLVEQSEGTSRATLDDVMSKLDSLEADVRRLRQELRPDEPR
jgi:voltage-gated potassium channel